MSKINVFSLFTRMRPKTGLSARAFMAAALLAFPGSPYAQDAGGEDKCIGCIQSDCQAAAPIIPGFHNNPIMASPMGIVPVVDFIIGADMPPTVVGWSANFRKYRTWLVTNDDKPDDFPSFFRNYFLRGLAIYTEQMSAVAMQQAMMIGQFFDAKHQLETQRLLQELQVQARKDYQPSEDYCWFGTNVRSMAASEKQSEEQKMTMMDMQMERHLATGTIRNDTVERWGQFTSKYCDPKDNNWNSEMTGLSGICGKSKKDRDDLVPSDPKLVNADIDYTRMVEEPRTINPSSSGDALFALSKNLYGNKALSVDATNRVLGKQENQHLYMALRSIAAKRSVAENSFNSIVAMKTNGTSNKYDDPNKDTVPGTAKFLGALIQDLGVPEKEVYGLLGDNPSYYAQLEILAKKIYENPDFYSNLYDTPVNVMRKAAALKAVELMVDREMFESELRQEMLMSVLLTSGNEQKFRSVNDDMMSINQAAPK